MCKLEWIAILISLLALGSSIFMLIRLSRVRKYDFYLALLKQYGSPEMLKALRYLWEFIERCGKDRGRIIKEYSERYGEPEDQLHSLRRVVKVYYEYLAFLYFHGLIPRKFKPELPTIDLRIIEFLEPIENVAIGKAKAKWGPKEGKEKEADYLPKKFNKSKSMYRLYNEWLRFQKESKD